MALVLSLACHSGLLVLWTVMVPSPPHRASTCSEPLRVSFLDVPVKGKKQATRADRAKPVRPDRLSAEPKDSARVAVSIPPPPTPAKKPASMAAPPAPSQEEWEVASSYTLKNSKHYRNDWGQLVRSMMGTAVEGPQQGLVRFHIEIAPDGRIAKVEELWATSVLAEKLAWKAIRALPKLPPTPTGKPLVFEQTIAFEPFETGWPPNYKFDFLQDTPPFHNPFAQDTASTRSMSQDQPESTLPSRASTVPDPISDTTDQIDTEDADMNRQLDQWGRGRLNGVK